QFEDGPEVILDRARECIPSLFSSKTSGTHFELLTLHLENISCSLREESCGQSHPHGAVPLVGVRNRECTFVGSARALSVPATSRWTLPGSGRLAVLHTCLTQTRSPELS